MTLEELQALAVKQAHQWQPPYTLALYGDMGAGKTTFARFLVEAMVGRACDVISPTFPIVQVYATPRGDVWHADLYRLKSLHEVEETGFIEAMHQHMCIVEWPQLIEPVLLNLPHACINLAR